MTPDTMYKEIIKKFARTLPKFPDGRIDYSSTNRAPVLHIYIMHDNHVLIVKRSSDVRAYKNMWSCIGGYLDELKPLKTKVLEEVQEELGILETDIKKVTLGSMSEYYDSKIDKYWIIFPAIVEMNFLYTFPKISLDWEATNYEWIPVDELKDREMVPNVVEVLESMRL